MLKTIKKFRARFDSIVKAIYKKLFSEKFSKRIWHFDKENRGLVFSSQAKRLEKLFAVVRKN